MDFSLQSLRAEWVTEKGIAPEDFLVLSLFVLGIDKTHFFQKADHALTEKQYGLLVGLLERRLNKEPVAYLVGTKEFFGREFVVNAATLIPRPDSECIIEDVVSFEKSNQKPDYIFDIGTGSGALIVTLASEIANASIQYRASDISAGALTIAAENARAHGANITFLQGSLLAPYKKILASPASVYIIANLPYVSEALLAKASPDVKEFEPRSALVSEEAGLAHYRTLLKELRAYTPSLQATCWLEISPEQTELLTEDILRIFPSTEVFVGQDLAPRNRFLRFTV